MNAYGPCFISAKIPTEIFDTQSTQRLTDYPSQSGWICEQLSYSQVGNLENTTSLLFLS